MELVEKVSQNVVTVPAHWSVSDIKSKLGGQALFIEPLSAKVSLAEFLLGGGLGWGSLRYGSFASKLYKVQTDKFVFGSNHSTSVNAGYPLHRLVEGMPHELSPYPDAKIERVTVPVRPAPQVKVIFRACSLAEAAVPAAAVNFMWVNAAAASALGVAGAGSLAFFEEYEPEGDGEPVEGIYEKRFFEDAIPQGYSLLKVLTVKSNLGKLEEMAKQSGRFFVCLWTHLGVLACISGQQSALAGIEKEALNLPLTYALPKKGGGPRHILEKEKTQASEPAASEEPEKSKPAEDKKEEPQKPVSAPSAEPAAPKEEEKKPEASSAPDTEKPESAGTEEKPAEQPAAEKTEQPAEDKSEEKKEDSAPEGGENPAPQEQ